MLSQLMRYQYAYPSQISPSYQKQTFKRLPILSKKPSFTKESRCNVIPKLR